MRSSLIWVAPRDIVVWLRSLGLGKYEAAFRDNGIDETVCRKPSKFCVSVNRTI
jgi:hypothetical protein